MQQKTDEKSTSDSQSLRGKEQNEIRSQRDSQCLFGRIFDFTIKYTTCQGDAVNIARDFAEGHDLAICCRGGGTRNETINGLISAGANIPIGYLPMGSANDLAVTLGIPTKLNEAA